MVLAAIQFDLLINWKEIIYFFRIVPWLLTNRVRELTDFNHAEMSLIFVDFSS